MWWNTKTVVARAELNGIYNHPLNIPISDTLRAILNELQEKGKQALVVGGAVRDAITGNIPKDIDIEVYGVSYPELQEILGKYSNHIDFAGKQFGVIKFTDNEGNPYDFSIPRRENKREGGLHTDFDIVPDPNMTPKDAASRRDFTWNSLAYNPLTGDLHDYFNGVEDLNNKVIRHTSGQFAEDPLRVLRGMQFASRFGFDIAPETAELAKQIAAQFTNNKLVHENRGVETDEFGNTQNVPHLAQERVAEEFMKFAVKAKYPSKILDYLVNTGWIKFFPLLKQMYDNLSQEYTDTLQPEHKSLYDGNGVPQDPEWHPEGNLWEHTKQTMDVAAAIADREGMKEDQRAIYIFSAMLHDIAKAGLDHRGGPITRLRDKKGVMRWTSHGHEQAGGPLAEQFLQQIGVKADIVSAVKTLIENHLGYISYGVNPTDKSINKLAGKLHMSKTNIETLMHLIEADQSGRTSRELKPNEVGKPKGLEPSAVNVLDKARELGVSYKPMVPFIQGKDIQMINPNLKPGPMFGQIIEKFYTLQTSGAIRSREEALQKLQEYFDKKRSYNQEDNVQQVD